MTKKKFYILAGFCIAGGVVAGVLAAPYLHVPSNPGIMTAQWADNYPTVGAMARDVDAVVLATVEDTRPGRTVFMADGRDPLPFTLVDLAVERVIRGEVEDLITVEQTGGSVDDMAYYVDGDGGLYQHGERVLLFLNQQPDSGYYYLVNPQGRFGVVDNELYAVVPDDPAARSLDRRNVHGAMRMIEVAD